MKRSRKFFLLINLFICLDLFSQSGQERIKLNQVGFYTYAPKIAVVTGNISAVNFSIVSADTKNTLYQGELSEENNSHYSTTKTKIANFSAFQKKGAYILVIPGVGDSYVFQISNAVHHNVAIAALKGYYFQRVSMPLIPKYAGKWQRAAGHPDTVVNIHPSAATLQRPAGSVISCPGGWYDAGDYNKYIVNSGITMGTLMAAYEDFPKYFDTLKTNIPESGNGAPDILNEILYNLRWMFTMQDPSDGGVYNKCTNAAFDGMVMPGVTKAPRYVVQKGTAATLDFAAVMAQASRVFRNFRKQFSGLSDSCLAAAESAWQWAIKNPELEYDQNAMNKKFEPVISTGGYGDRNFKDEWFWAASELLVTTKNTQYEILLMERWNDPINLPSWGDVRMLGYYTICRNEKSLPASGKIQSTALKARIIHFADSLITNGGNRAFETIMGQSTRDFIWGSNAVAANQSIILINAYLLTKNKKYIPYALSNLDYLLGRNATGYCFVTGIGSKSTMHPHHRQSVADGITEPVPGLLAGGPNPGRQDKCHYDFIEPETAYADIDCAYASNEIAINWNAPLVYLANAIEALQWTVGYSRKNY
jgi:endoglucanase